MSKRLGDPGYAAGWCIHYCAPPRGLRNDKPHICEAGVNMEVFAGTKFDTRPCFLDDKGESKPGAAECSRIQRPTSQQIAAHERWVESRMDVMRTVIVGIAPWRKAHKGQSFAEVVECPACKGRLRLSIAAYNGHVHGHCETAGCVSWME